jgi:hypothetical protein
MISWQFLKHISLILRNKKISTIVFAYVDVQYKSDPVAIDSAAIHLIS